jgi:hypothetical protein
MGQVLHGSATTTEAIRRAIQDSRLRSSWRFFGGLETRPASAIVKAADRNG